MDHYSQLLQLIHVGQLVFVIVANTFKLVSVFFFQIFIFHIAFKGHRVRLIFILVPVVKASCCRRSFQTLINVFVLFEYSSW